MRLKNTVLFTDREDLIVKMTAELKKPNWAASFCQYKDEMPNYARTDDTAIACAGTGKGIFESLDESFLKEKLRNILLSRVEEIADWLLAPLEIDNIQLRLTGREAGLTGYTYNTRKQKVSAPCYMVVLRRTVHLSPFGFFIPLFRAEEGGVL